MKMNQNKPIPAPVFQPTKEIISYILELDKKMKQSKSLNK